MRKESDCVGINKGWLTCDRTTKGDEVYTPFYAVEPLLKYLKPNSKIWCPFDKDWSAFKQLLEENGHTVFNTFLETNEDGTEYGNFFEIYDDLEMHREERFDYIISNPPFSTKDDVLEALYELDIPFMILLPMNSLQGKNRYKYFKNGVQLLCFDARIDYHTNNNFKEYTKGNHFASAYFCKGVLPKDLIIEELYKYSRPLKGSDEE